MIQRNELNCTVENSCECLFRVHTKLLQVLFFKKPSFSEHHGNSVRKANIILLSFVSKFAQKFNNLCTSNDILHNFACQFTRACMLFYLESDVCCFKVDCCKNNGLKR